MFDTVPEAEAFICLEVPRATDVPGWRVEYVVASRSLSLGEYRSGRGLRALNIGYSDREHRAGLELLVPGEGDTDALGGARDIKIQGVTGKIWVGGEPQQYAIQWTKDRDTMMAFGAMVGGLDLEDDILPFIKTVH
jgi:hypothetical protein